MIANDVIVQAARQIRRETKSRTASKLERMCKQLGAEKRNEIDKEKRRRWGNDDKYLARSVRDLTSFPRFILWLAATRQRLTHVTGFDPGSIDEIMQDIQTTNWKEVKRIFLEEFEHPEWEWNENKQKQLSAKPDNVRHLKRQKGNGKATEKSISLSASAWPRATDPKMRIFFAPRFAANGKNLFTLFIKQTMFFCPSRPARKGAACCAARPDGSSDGCASVYTIREIWLATSMSKDKSKGLPSIRCFSVCPSSSSITMK
jgi:hypothetical protein